MEHTSIYDGRLLKALKEFGYKRSVHKQDHSLYDCYHIGITHRYIYTYHLKTNYKIEQL